MWPIPKHLCICLHRMLYKLLRPVLCSPRYTCSRWTLCFPPQSRSFLGKQQHSPPKDNTLRWPRTQRDQCFLQEIVCLRGRQSTLRCQVYLYIDLPGTVRTSLCLLCTQQHIGNLPTHRCRPGRLSWMGMPSGFRHRDSKNRPRMQCRASHNTRDYKYKGPQQAPYTPEIRKRSPWRHLRLLGLWNR